MSKKIKKNKNLKLNLLILIITLIVIIIFFEFLSLSLNKHTNFIKDEKKGYLPFETITNLTKYDDNYHSNVFVYNPNGSRNYSIKHFDPNLIYLKHPDYKNIYCSDKKEKFRIIFIGDSVTENFKHNLKKSFADIVQQKLNNKFPKSFEVLNFAKGSYGLFEIKQLIDDSVIPCNPDLVIYSFVQNDFSVSPIYTFTSTQIIPAKGIKFIRNVFITSKFGNYLYENSALYPLFLIKSTNILSKIFPKYFNVDYHVNLFDQYSRGLEYNYKSLQYITKSLKKINSSFIILNVPYVNKGFTTKYNFSHATKYNLTIYQLSHYLNYKINDSEKIRHKDDDSKYWHDNFHFNLKGNEIIADYIYAILNKDKYLKNKKT
jgi:hypothetical protein